MKVRALKLFNDLQSKKLRKVNEMFEVTAKRVEEINSTLFAVLWLRLLKKIKRLKKKPALLN